MVNHLFSDKLGLILFSTEGGGSQASITGVEIASKPAKRNIMFRSGIVAEHRSLLGSSATGAFGRMSGSSVFAGLEGNWRVGSWRLSAGAEIGTVAADVDENLLSIRSPLHTSAFAL